MTDEAKAVVASGSLTAGPGPLSQKVLEYTELMRTLVPSARTPGDWEPLEKLVAVEEFERVGNYMEVHNWRQYTEMLTQWVSGTHEFETEVRRISEMPGRVFFEIQETHFRGDRTDVVNSMSVFQFNDEGKICHLDIYLQQPQTA